MYVCFSLPYHSPGEQITAIARCTPNMSPCAGCWEQSRCTLLTPTHLSVTEATCLGRFSRIPPVCSQSGVKGFDIMGAQLLTTVLLSSQCPFILTTTATAFQRVSSEQATSRGFNDALNRNCKASPEEQQHGEVQSSHPPHCPDRTFQGPPQTRRAAQAAWPSQPLALSGNKETTHRSGYSPAQAHPACTTTMASGQPSDGCYQHGLGLSY